MGGIIGISTTCYVFCARHIPGKFGEKSMGILPPLFLVFKNYENIKDLKARIEQIDKTSSSTIIP